MPEVKVYSSNLCPYCWEARRILNRYRVDFELIPVWLILGWKLPTKNFKEMRQRSGGKTTVPQIFVDGQYYGDEETLKNDIASDRLPSFLLGPSETSAKRPPI